MGRFSSHSQPFSLTFCFWAAFLFLLGFFVFPLIVVLGVSFASRGLYGGVEWIATLDNYRRLANPLIGVIFLRSLVFASVTTVMCAVIGFPLAYMVARASTRWQMILLTLVMIPFWTNFLVRTYAWILILRADGLINAVLFQLGMQTEPLSILFTDMAVLIGLVYGYLPFMVLPLIVAIERISPQLEEAAFDLYASVSAMFRHVIVPLSKPGFVAGGVLVFIPSLGAFITPYILGGGQKMMIGTLIQQEFLMSRDWPFGAALSFGLMGTALMLWFLVNRMTLNKEML